MVRELADRSPAGFTEPQWATLAKLKRTGGTWGTYKSKLVVAGLVEKRGDLWYATDLAIAEYGDPGRAPSGAEDVLSDWISKLGGGPGRLLSAVVESPGISRAELAERCGLSFTGGTFGTYLSKLRANGLIEDRDGLRPTSPLV